MRHKFWPSAHSADKCDKLPTYNKTWIGYLMTVIYLFRLFLFDLQISKEYNMNTFRQRSRRKRSNRGVHRVFFFFLLFGWRKILIGNHGGQVAVRGSAVASHPSNFSWSFFSSATYFSFLKHFSAQSLSPTYCGWLCVNIIQLKHTSKSLSQLLDGNSASWGHRRNALYFVVSWGLHCTLFGLADLRISIILCSRFILTLLAYFWAFLIDAIRSLSEPFLHSLSSAGVRLTTAEENNCYLSKNIVRLVWLSFIC